MSYSQIVSNDTIITNIQQRSNDSLNVIGKAVIKGLEYKSLYFNTLSQLKNLEISNLILTDANQYLQQKIKIDTVIIEKTNWQTIALMTGIVSFIEAMIYIWVKK